MVLKLHEEVDLLKTLKHVNIVTYLGTCLEDNILSIFMEFVPGGSISSIIHRSYLLQQKNMLSLPAQEINTYWKHKVLCI
uniref:Protein kinase domain-containing protein n=1 Tax=Anser brachyrhynchus TaxID=132585 RepID=A0A8B9BG27_9AVES